MLDVVASISIIWTSFVSHHGLLTRAIYLKQFRSKSAHCGRRELQILNHYVIQLRFREEIKGMMPTKG